MPIRRRDVLKLGALAGAAGLAPAFATAAAPAVERAAKPLDILILGGTGFTGPHQVRYALARGHRITLFNRGRRPQDWPAEVEELTGDRETGDVGALKGRRWDVCIDNPTSVPHWVRDVGQVLKGQVDHYLFISTLSVYSDSATPGQDEDAPRAVYTGPDIMAETRASLIANMALYGPMKAACEDEALKWFPDITTLIRPGLIVGPGDETDRFSYWPLRVRRGGDILAPGDGRDPVQFIDARDLAEWTIRMAEQRAFGAFNAMGPAYAMGMDQLLYGIQAVTGTAATFHWAPAEFLAEQNVSPWGDMPVWVPGQGESAGFSRHRNDRALAKGLSFRPLADTVAATLAWFDAQPEERRATLRAGIKPEREAEVLAAWRARAAAG
ncbi:NAD-dependent epimerase/dehydratase family protein [uncultured Aquimonas sp.]|uniref:NAD-dependent epimerase/dehydratase family protein n=1 Tax=uncultured Aquimonas sp. TaxID=385483 RepID=UPI000869DFE8|nr:NAD-dependent epimerase/dehydratase family protein [uncultured Aquimonas sp.]ODU42091.1 MAG: epimerase [Xanthomonadaceae bacterium SCN 69-123]